ncbi:unnamed protein product [Aphanomyces euteiches]
MGMARNTATKEDVPKKKDGKKGQKEEAKPAPVDYASIDHPYVVILNKKLRAFKKKQEKIKQLEDSLKGQTKQLNEQQLEVLSNKPFVEKMCVELELLRQQFVETLTSSNSAPISKAGKDEDAAPASDEGDTSSLNHLNEDVPDAKDVEEMVHELDEDLNPAEPAPVANDEDVKLEYVESILKLLHAVSLHQALGHEVPMALDYFVKVLMGGTRPPAEVSFAENLAESLEEAKRYVHKSDKILALDMSYRHLSDTVDRLVAPLKPAEPVVEEPHINFFTESALDKAPVEENIETPAGEDDSYVVVDVEKTETKSARRPNSGNRRQKSPREGAAANGDSHGDKPQKPRKVYQPKVKPSADGVEGGAPRAPRTYAPKGFNDSKSPLDGDKRPANRRPNSKQGPRPKKAEQDAPTP